MNVIGEPVDERVPSALSPTVRMPSRFRGQSTEVEMFETGIKVVDLLAPYPVVERSASSAALASARPFSSWSSSQHRSEHGGVAAFGGVGERTREGNDLWFEMMEAGVINAKQEDGHPLSTKAAIVDTEQPRPWSTVR